MTDFRYLKFGTTDPSAPLIILLHGRGANEASLSGLASSLDSKYRIISLRGPIELSQNSYTWFENRGIGRPIPDSLRLSLEWFYQFINVENPQKRPVVIVGFSGGAAFAGALALDKRLPLTGVAILYGTVPFDAGLAIEKGSLKGLDVFVAQGNNDTVMPIDLMTRTWNYLLEDSDANVESNRSNGGHEITPEVASKLSDWIKNIISSKN